MATAVVTTLQGKLSGKCVRSSFNKNTYFSFQGIPYAKPPIKQLRFKAPEPIEPWTGIREATAHGSICYSRHFLFKNIVGSEDCLFLNVYTPQLPSPTVERKPVMVWIHGGGFNCGSGNDDFYDPEFLLAEDVVLVTINYRLGLLGFLCLEDPSLEIPGNAGLKDQVMALRWVKSNIEQFNGDSNNVTIFGESAGGHSVHYLVLSPLTKGLFHRAIIQSGSALSCRSKGKTSTSLIADALGIPSLTEKDLLQKLMNMPVDKILELQDQLPDPFVGNDIRPYGPIIEKPSENAFITEDPAELIKSGNFNNVPIMIGFTSREGVLAEIISKGKCGQIKFTKDFEELVPHSINLPRGSTKSKEIAAKIKNFYYGNETPSMENLDQYHLLYGDVIFVKPILYAVELHTLSSTNPVYVYRMSIVTSLNIFKHFCHTISTGVCHSDDIGYLFKTVLTKDIRPESIENISIQRFAKMWTNFARNGNPNPVREDTLINIFWKPAERNKLHFIDFGENLTVGINPEERRMQFWDSIINDFKNSC